MSVSLSYVRRNASEEALETPTSNRSREATIGIPGWALGCAHGVAREC